MLRQCGSSRSLDLECYRRRKLSRISTDVTPEEHQRLKAVAAQKGQSIEGYVRERTLGEYPQRLPWTSLKLFSISAFVQLSLAP